MYRPLVAVVVVATVLFACTSPHAEASTPAPTAIPSPKATKRPATFSNNINSPTGQSSRVSAADCNRRAVAAAPAGGRLGPNGASTSQTLIAVPIGGGDTAAATREQQISEACAHRRH